MDTTAAAHIITADAVALGTPELIIMTRDNGSGATVIGRHALPTVAGWVAALQLLSELGWHVPANATATYVETGYAILDVTSDP